MRPSNDPADRMDMSLDTLVPDNPNKPYDMKELILKTVDDGDFFELQPEYARTSSSALPAWKARWWASWPTSRWCWPVAWTSSRASRPRALCAFAMRSTFPWSRLWTCPASCPAPAKNTAASSHGAKLLYAYAECTVPKITVITRKAYGGAYDVMSSKHLRGDVNLAWPNAEIAVMGAKGAVEIIFREDKNDPVKLAAREAEYKQRFANPFVAGARGFIDDVILPHETRKRICRSLVMLQNKKIENPWRKREHSLLVHCHSPLGRR